MESQLNELDKLSKINVLDDQLIWWNWDQNKQRKHFGVSRSIPGKSRSFIPRSRSFSFLTLSWFVFATREASFASSTFPDSRQFFWHVRRRWQRKRQGSSVTRLGDFLKLLAANLLTKVAPKRLVTFRLICKKDKCI